MWKCVQEAEWLKAYMIKTHLRQKQFSLYSCKSISLFFMYFKVKFMFAEMSPCRQNV